MYLPSSPQPSTPSPQPLRRKRRSPVKHPSARRQRQRAMVVELSAKLAVNGVLLTAAVASLIRLVPSLQDKRADLMQVQSAVAIAKQETTRLKADFGRYFDPQQARNVMQEESGWEVPTQRQIVWIAPDPSGGPQPSESE